METHWYVAQNGDGKLGILDALSAVKNGNLGDLLGGFFKEVIFFNKRK